MGEAICQVKFSLIYYWRLGVSSARAKGGATPAPARALPHARDPHRAYAPARIPPRARESHRAHDCTLVHAHLCSRTRTRESHRARDLTARDAQSLDRAKCYCTFGH